MPISSVFGQSLVRGHLSTVLPTGAGRLEAEAVAVGQLGQAPPSIGAAGPVPAPVLCRLPSASADPYAVSSPTDYCPPEAMGVTRPHWDPARPQRSA